MDEIPDTGTKSPGENPTAPTAQPQTLNTSPLTYVPIEITVSVGRARPLVGELLTMQQDHVLELDRRVDDAVELYVGDRMIGRGELQELDGADAGKLAVRLTEVADLQNGL